MLLVSSAQSNGAKKLSHGYHFHYCPHYVVSVNREIKKFIIYLVSVERSTKNQSYQSSKTFYDFFSSLNNFMNKVI